MPDGQWSAKRERQYDHIKKGLLDRGDPAELAEEIAAMTVNKQRARALSTTSPDRGRRLPGFLPRDQTLWRRKPVPPRRAGTWRL
jgi:hypothetical protein